jgi:alpha,alpha-trehalose-phosphate synthase [UDP-forming]
MMPEGRTWDREALGDLVRERLGERRLIVVSNREPYVHARRDGNLAWSRPVGGLTEALDPVMQASGGCWVALGTGDADREAVDDRDRVAVPPDNPRYTLRRVWLTGEDYRGYYLGFANETLWPLCHAAFVRPAFGEAAREAYRRVNRLFAEAVLEEAGGGPAVVLVQDYHFALLPALLKERRPDLTVGQFWHIPWPPWEVFRTCPWRDEIVTGLLGNDLLGFHLPSFGRNFKEAADRCCPAATGGTAVEAFPISVDFEAISTQAADPAVELEMEDLSRTYELEGKYLGFGLDRLDYTKGIPERLAAYRRFLEENPDYLGSVVFVQAGMPSRTQIDAYQDLGFRVEGLIADINETFGTAVWQPVVALSRHLAPVTLNALRRLARFCIVSSLDDGMNLVAKEFVAARNDEDGVLLLSEFAGAAAELPEALPVNPYDTAGFAAAIRQALEMPEEARRDRMRAMRETVREHNIYKWGADIVARLLEQTP